MAENEYFFGEPATEEITGERKRLKKEEEIGLRKKKIT
jgi:hypothetical protein